MKKVIMICTAAFLSQFAQAEHREHGAHVHGLAQLSIAFDNLKGQIEIHSPADSIVGFEHSAKTTADKKKLKEALDLLENKISEIVVIDTAAACKITKNKIEVVKDEDHDEDHHHEGEHSDVVAAYDVLCTATPKREQISIHLQKFFPRVKKLNVTYLAGDVQKSDTIENSK